MKFREANISDTKEIVKLLANDILGSQRDGSSDLSTYSQAMSEIVSDANAVIIVGEIDGTIVACAQLNFMRCLSHGAAKRGQIENVRVHQDYRGQKLGETLIAHCIEFCKARGCKIIQLMSDKQRTDAIRFYNKMGFKSTHKGLKLFID